MGHCTGLRVRSITSRLTRVAQVYQNAPIDDQEACPVQCASSLQRPPGVVLVEMSDRYILERIPQISISSYLKIYNLNRHEHGYITVSGCRLLTAETHEHGVIGLEEFLKRAGDLPPTPLFLLHTELLRIQSPSFSSPQISTSPLSPLYLYITFYVYLYISSSQWIPLCSSLVSTFSFAFCVIPDRADDDLPHYRVFA